MFVFWNVSYGEFMAIVWKFEGSMLECMEQLYTYRLHQNARRATGRGANDYRSLRLTLGGNAMTVKSYITPKSHKAQVRNSSAVSQ